MMTAADPQVLELPIQGMDCAGCATTVQKAIAQLPGVKTVDVLLSSEKAVIQLDQAGVDIAAIRNVVEKAGYSVPFKSQVLEVSIGGMDCAGCVDTVHKAIVELPGVHSAEVLLSAEKAIIELDEAQVGLPAIRKAVERAGYSVTVAEKEPAETNTNDFSKAALNLFGVVFGLVLLVVVAGEGLGLFETITSRVPPILGYGLVLVGALPTFRSVIRAALNKQIISHTLMSVGLLAALAVGQWVTAAIVLLFIRVGDYAERFTTERSRRALKNLTAMAPQTARVERDGREIELPIAEIHPGDVVIVRPGEKIAVDGEVISGSATINQAAITGESMPVEAGAGSRVFAASIAQLGSLRVRTKQIGADTTFGRIIRLVEEAESHRADVQRVADRFSAYFLPVVSSIAILTFLISRNPISTAAVLVVACSCSFALATPIAMLASIGAAAKNGLLIKGGKYIEALAAADVVLLDKTGTLTLGQPKVTDVIALNGRSENELLSLAASAERYSEHPLAQAVREAAHARQLPLHEPHNFEAIPGHGVRAVVNGSSVAVGGPRMLASANPLAEQLQAAGKTAVLVALEGEIIGLLGVADTLRSEIPEALTALRGQGVKEIVMLTGDNERVAHSVANQLGISYRADLLPEDKIAIVRQYQAEKRVVVMVGDGVNDAPALAQADVGIAMAAAGTDVAIEAAHIALMREDWSLIPEAFRIARRTMGIVKANIGFTAVYNVFGLALAAFGILPPILAAAAQSLPDLGILANSSRLLRYQRSNKA
ncbi:MAG TPA: heavy metal translocating P-type ATPase [Anaerolineales bacterium]|nr:heavy metal translocating P-type ATPase [Anaerolineales bacterium]